MSGRSASVSATSASAYPSIMSAKVTALQRGRRDRSRFRDDPPEGLNSPCASTLITGYELHASYDPDRDSTALIRHASLIAGTV